MIPAAFDYVRAGSAEEAISLIGEHGEDAKFLAGGHRLLPLLKLRLAQPTVLVDIGRVSDLSYINDGGDVWSPTWAPAKARSACSWRSGWAKAARSIPRRSTRTRSSTPDPVRRGHPRG